MKKTKLLTLALASVMGLSAFALASCGEKDPGKDDPKDDPTPVAETGFLKDESIKGKIIAGYTFENGGAAINPYTGEAISKLDVRVTDEAGVVSQGISGSKALESGTAGIKLPKMGDTMDEDTGVSFTYLNYGTGDGYGDWNILLSSDFLTLNYGNITFSGGSAYPSICSELGYGAFGAAGLKEAQDAGLTASQLASTKAPNVYYGYNAGCVEAKADTQTNYRAKALYDDMVDNWQVMTVTVTTDNVTFYRNGAMAYRYARSIFEGANKSNGEFFLADLVDYEEEGDSALYMFTGAGGVVDNLIIGQALNTKEVLALYNDLAASAGKSTKTEADVVLLDPDASTKIDAQAKALQAAIASYKSALVAAAEKPEDVEGAVLTLGATDCTQAWWSAFAGVTPTYGEDGKSFDVTVEGTLFSNMGANWNGVCTIINSDGVDHIVRMDNFGWAGDGYTSTHATVSCDWNFDTMPVDMNDAKVKIQIVFDGTTATVTYTLTPKMAGETYEGSQEVTLSDGTTYTGTASLTVAETYTQVYTITGLKADTGVFPSFVVDGSCVVFTSVTGGTFAE